MARKSVFPWSQLITSFLSPQLINHQGASLALTRLDVSGSAMPSLVNHSHFSLNPHASLMIMTCLSGTQSPFSTTGR